MIETAPESTFGSMTTLLRSLKVGDEFILDTKRVKSSLFHLARRVGIKVSSREDPDRPGYHRVTRIA